MSSSVTDSPASATPAAKQRRRLRSPWVWAVGLGVLPLLAWGGHVGWRWIQTRQFRQQCDSARVAGDWRYQRKLAGEWAAWDSQSGIPWWYAAEAAQKLDDLDDLADCLGRVPPSDPNALVAAVEKANLEWTALNRPLAALETSRQVLAINPRIVEVQSRVVSFYAMNLQRVPMLKAIRAAIAVGAEPRESYAYLAMADALTFSNGAKLNSRWLAAAPDEVRFKIGLGIHTAITLSQNASQEGVPNAAELDREATQQLQWFLEQVPHDPVLLTYLMDRAYVSADVKRMGELLERVDGDTVDDHMVWVFRSWYHLSFHEHSAAEDAIREALRLHPMSPLAHHEYAKLLRACQRPEAEVEHEQKLAAAGREVRRKVLQNESATDLTLAQFEEIVQYAQDCGDEQVASALKIRLQPSGDTTSRPAVGTPGFSSRK